MSDSPYRGGQADPVSPWELVPPVLYWDDRYGSDRLRITPIGGNVLEFERTERRRVPGGWLYRVTQFPYRLNRTPDFVNIVFVPSQVASSGEGCDV